MRLSKAFLLLICLQAAHSAEEFSFGLYDFLPYFRPFGDAAAQAFLIANVMVVAFGFWCYFFRVKPGATSAPAWAIGWAVLEIANGILHPVWSLTAGVYIPGTVTAPLLLVAGLYLLSRIASGSVLLSALLSLVMLSACGNEPESKLGRFELNTDLFLAHFDSKTDVDDLHSVAGVATMLADPRFTRVQYHAVAGAYGIQEGLYVPAPELFDAAFGEQWSDAHTDFERALAEVTALAVAVLRNGGDIWIADAGQSDFSAALVDAASRQLEGEDISTRVHVVQHSDWNESVTSPERLQYLQANADYRKIADGNAVGNGTPGFRSEVPVAWRDSITDPRLAGIWETAIRIGNTYNGQEGRYLNEAIAQGGLDFSDVSEACWIFGFEDLSDATAFFSEFASQREDG